MFKIILLQSFKTFIMCLNDFFFFFCRTQYLYMQYMQANFYFSMGVGAACSTHAWDENLPRNALPWEQEFLKQLSGASSWASTFTN